MYCAVCPHKLQQKPCSPLARGRPRVRTFGRHTGIRTRMHQRLDWSWDKTVNDKEILFEPESWVQPCEIAGMIVLNTMAEYQVLSTSGRTDWIGLNKAESVESAFQRRGLEKTARDCKAAQIIQGNQHGSILLKSSQR